MFSLFSFGYRNITNCPLCYTMMSFFTYLSTRGIDHSSLVHKDLWKMVH